MVTRVNGTPDRRVNETDTFGGGGGGVGTDVTVLNFPAEQEVKNDAGNPLSISATVLDVLLSTRASEATSAAMQSDIDRKFDLITPFSSKFSSSNASVIDPGAGNRLRIFQIFTQANPSNAAALEFAVAIGATTIDAGWLKPSQPSMFGGMLYEGANGEKLALTLTGAGEVRLNVRYKVV